VSTATELLGTALAAPVIVAPTALHTLAEPEGEVATARGAAAAGSLLVLSSRSGREIAAVAAAAGPWWYQVYVLRDRAITRDQVGRAVLTGAQCLVLTADAPYVFPRAGVQAPLPVNGAVAALSTPGQRPADREQDPALCLDDIGWLSAMSGLPVLVKGVLRADDAAACVSAGAAGVIVSNHGGRQLDRSISTASALAPIVDMIADTVPVLVDGGIRDGRDVLTALALGASAVLIGRPVLWALSTGGAAGVQSCLDFYRADLQRAMSLAGIRDVSDIGADLITPAIPSGP
jgi:4-hydroxymandelate oxidase